MPANKINYLVLFDGNSQVYGSAAKDTALSTPPPKGYKLEEKRVLFITFEPDSGELSVHQVPQEEVMSAEILEKQPKKVKEDGEA